MKKIIAAALTLALLMGLASCGKPTEKENNSGSSGSISEPIVQTKPDGVVDVVWWTNYGKANVEYLQRTIDAFNASQSDYKVSIIYQGNASELNAKIQSTAPEDLPALFNLAVQRVGVAADAEYCVPIQDFIDKDQEGWPELENTYESLRAAYSDGDGRLIGYPNGYSYGGVYYNATMLKEAGIDPADIKSLEDIYSVSKKLISEGDTTFGIGFHPSGFYFNAVVGREGVQLYDNDNGYSGKITKCLYTEDQAAHDTVASMLTFYQNLYADKLAIPYGSDYQAEIIPQFASGNCAMFMGVVSMTTKILDAVDGQFEVGIMPLPSVTEGGKQTGEPAGGTGIFIGNNGDEWQMRGAYEFIKFMSRGEYSADFAYSTGYLAPNSDAYEDAEYQKYISETFPAVSVVYDSLAASDDSARNPFIGVANEMEAANKLAIETVASDAGADVEQVLKTAAESIQEAIDLYNMSNP